MPVTRGTASERQTSPQPTDHGTTLDHSLFFHESGSSRRGNSGLGFGGVSEVTHFERTHKVYSITCQGRIVNILTSVSRGSNSELKSKDRFSRMRLSVISFYPSRKSPEWYLVPFTSIPMEETSLYKAIFTKTVTLIKNSCS